MCYYYKKDIKDVLFRENAYKIVNYFYYIRQNIYLPYLLIHFRSFFFGSFVTALIITVHLISNIYVKWNSTPVIIGISPQATSILKVPFPAVTICNMNQVQRSLVANYRE